MQRWNHCDGILVVDAEGQVGNFNDHFKKMWQLPESVAAVKNMQLTTAHWCSTPASGEVSRENSRDERPSGRGQF